jgi:lipid-A-disaccharide synthase
LPVRVVRSAREALACADAAAIASGTAVLEAALLEVPTVGLYVLSDAQAKIARRIYRGRFITLPNLVLDEPVVPELLQEAATPRALADALEALLCDGATQLTGFRRLRAALGPADALERCARFALELTAR